MPNVLAHYGAQGPLSRLFVRASDTTWILVGCTVSDVPWMLQRVLRSFENGLDPIDIRLYAIVQSSLLASLFLCGALAFLAARPLRVFVILSVNTLLHLLLDAAQTKWGNGVHLIAPLSWTHLNLGLFWPESGVTYALTAAGLLFCLWAWTHPAPEPTPLRLPVGRRLFVALLLLAAYVAVPFAFLSGPLEADNSSTRTLRDPASHVGGPVAFDRRPFEPSGTAGEGTITAFNDLELRAVGSLPRYPTQVSARGVLTAPDTVRIDELHEHPRWSRDLASYVGLTALALFVLRDLFRGWRARRSRP